MPTKNEAISFNEAGGFLPRKLDSTRAYMTFLRTASMRPGDFSPGNVTNEAPLSRELNLASMRPGDFSPGNTCETSHAHGSSIGASMRPGDFSPGNSLSDLATYLILSKGFNEAGGFLPRKPLTSCAILSSES